MADQPPSGTILQLDNPRAMQNSMTSEIIEFGGFKWRLEVRKKEATDALDFFVHCHPSEASVAIHSLWMCLVDFRLRIIQTGPVKTVVSGKKFFFNDYIWCSEPFSSINGRQWSFDHAITIEFELIEIRRSTLGKKMRPLDTILCMEFDGKTELVRVNKSELAIHSIYFRNLFNGQWSERENENGHNGSEFIIREEPDFNIYAFRLMLNSAQIMGWMAHETNFLTAGELAVQIVKMSIKYDVPMLLDYGQKHLTKASDMRKMEMLLFAEEFGLRELKDHCLKSITAMDYGSDLERSTEIRGKLSQETRQKLDAQVGKYARDRGFIGGGFDQHDPWAD